MQNPDSLASRMRWVMLGVMIAAVGLTLACQPPGFWHDPSAAVRFDGLSIHDPTNAVFTWFLGYGATPFLLASALAIGFAFVLVSRAPEPLALVAAFAAILWYYYCVNNWLALTWHVSIAGEAIPAGVLGYAVTRAAAPRLAVDEALVVRLAVVLTLIVSLDAFNTLLGQPAAYWADTSNVLEGNVVARWALIHGWWAYCLYILATIAAYFGAARMLAKPIGLIVIVAGLANSFVGASAWYLYVWRSGVGVIIAVAVALSVAITAYGIYGTAVPGALIRGRQRFCR